MKVLPVYLDSNELSDKTKKRYNNLSEAEKLRLDRFISMSFQNMDITEIPLSLKYHFLKDNKKFSAIYLDDKNKRAIFEKVKIGDVYYLVLCKIILSHKEYNKFLKNSIDERTENA